MASWSLLHMKSIKNSNPPFDKGLIRELTQASSRSMNFSVDQPHTLTFTLPGNSIQTKDINVLADDILVYRDGYVVQRFRVVSRSLGKAGGELTASFSCVSYKALLDAWIFHDTDKRTWAESESAASRDQSLIAWTIFNQGQSRSASHNLGVIRGNIPIPGLEVPRVLEIPGSFGGPSPEDYYQIGQKRKQAIDDLGDRVDGFEWDIVPYQSSIFDPNTMTSLRFEVYQKFESGTTLLGGHTYFILDDGGNVAEWEINNTPSDYANVIRATGSQLTTENFPVDGNPSASYWWNGTSASENPAGTPYEGVWERDINNADWSNLAAVQTGSKDEFVRLNERNEEITVTLARGRWPGHLLSSTRSIWLGDTPKFIVTVPVKDHPGEYVINRDELMRVMAITIDVDDLGAEDVKMSLNRPPYNSARDSQSLERRVKNLEIR